MGDTMNVYQKLAKIRSLADVVKKDKKGFNYTYADITQILAKITAGMKKYEISLIPSIIPGSMSVSQNVVVNTKVDKTGKPYEQTSTEMLISADMEFKWVNDERPEEVITVPWIVTGSQGDPSQAFGSGLTYCTRYFLTSYFQIGQVDTDVDEYRTKQKEAEMQEAKLIAQGIMAEFDTIIKEFISDNQDRADEVKSFVGKYIKDAKKYMSIDNPDLAQKLLNDFKEKYLTEKKG